MSEERDIETIEQLLINVSSQFRLHASTMISRLYPPGLEISLTVLNVNVLIKNEYELPRPNLPGLDTNS